MRRLSRPVCTTKFFTPIKRHITHDAFLFLCQKVLEANNYQVNLKAEGLCFGTSITAAQLHLVDGLEEFNNILEILDKVKPNAISRKPLEFADIKNDEAVIALFNMIHAYQNAQKIPKLEHQFNSLVEKGGLVQTQTISGSYTVETLAAALKQLRTAFDKFAKPVSIILNDNKHAVSLNYNPHTKQWIFYDTNSLPMKCFTVGKEEEIAATLKSSLSGENGNIVLSGNIFTCGIYEKELNQELLALFATLDWNSTHKPTASNAYLKNGEGFSNFHAACRAGDTQKMKILINEFKVDVNSVDDRGRPALYYAIKSSSFDAVAVLISAGATIPKESIYLAKTMELFQVAKLLEGSLVNQSKKTDEKSTRNKNGMLSSMFACAKPYIESTSAYGFYKEHLEFHPRR